MRFNTTSSTNSSLIVYGAFQITCAKLFIATDINLENIFAFSFENSNSAVFFIEQ